MAELALDGEGGQLVAEGRGEDGDGNGEEVRELSEGHHRAQLGRLDVFRDEPQADEDVEAVCRAHREEEHQRVPPEVAELGVKALEKVFHGTTSTPYWGNL